MLTCTSVVVDVFCSRAALVGWSRARVCVCLCLWCVKIIHKNREKKFMHVCALTKSALTQSATQLTLANNNKYYFA